MPKKYTHKTSGALFRDIILGGQDGLVNILGLMLGVYTATSDPSVVILSGLAAGLAEAISMGAVAYTSLEAEKEFYERALRQESQNIDNYPDREKEELKELYLKKGLKESQAKEITDVISSDRKVWLSTIMAERLGLSEHDLKSNLQSSLLVGLSAAVGALIPLLSFFFIQGGMALVISLSLSAISLFTLGFVKASFTERNKLWGGAELLLIGMGAGIIGFLIGNLFKEVIS